MTRLNALEPEQASGKAKELFTTINGKLGMVPSQALNRMEISNLQNPQSIQVINKELIQDRQIQSVGEALKLMAGVNAFSSSQYSDYVMRGFRGTSGNLAYNGDHLLP